MDALRVQLRDMQGELQQVQTELQAERDGRAADQGLLLQAAERSQQDAKAMDAARQLNSDLTAQLAKQGEKLGEYRSLIQAQLS